MSPAPEATLADHGDWPHTKRLMPWTLAAFIVMVFLIPFDGTLLKIHLPVDSKLDRFMLGALVAVLIIERLTSTARRKGSPRMTAITVAALIFTGIALLSIVVNIDRIDRLGQLTLAEKQLSQLLAYVLFYLIVAKTVRPNEIPAFGRLILVLACITSVGVLYESRSGFNAFYVWTAKLLSPIATVLPSPTNIHPIVDRKIVVGPTQHGLALASMLTMALPFAILGLSAAKRNGKRLLYLLAIGLIIAAALATARKTAILAPIAALIVLAAYNRRMLRWAPLALLVLIPVIHFASPGALGTFRILANSSSSNSTLGRMSDYSAITPDILANPIIGRGFGTLDPDNVRWYRILDNQYLGELFAVGLLGLAAYLALVCAPLATAHRVIRRGGPLARPVLAAAAGCAAYALVSATFDALSFPQAPYMFFFAAGLITAAASASPTEPAQAARAPARDSPPVQAARAVVSA